MSAAVAPHGPWTERARGLLGEWVGSAFVVAASVVAGYLFVLASAPITRDRYFDWIAGRALGLAAYLVLFFLVCTGVWNRHPWRMRWAIGHPEVRLRIHAVLGAAAVVLVAGHIVSLAADRYAGVGWSGALLPGLSHYRTTAVAIGVGAWYLLCAITLTAALAGRLIGRRWLLVHRFGVLMFAAAWFHGVLSGTDEPRLRVAYALTGAFVAALAGTRYAATRTLPSAASGTSS